MNNKFIVFFCMFIVCGLSSFLILDSTPIHGDAENFANYKLLHSSKASLEFQDLNTYFVSLIYGDKPFSFFVNVICLFLIVIFGVNVVKDRWRYEIFIFVLLNPLWLSRFAEPSREFLLYLFCYFLGVGLVTQNRYLKWVSIIMVCAIRPVSSLLTFTWVWLFETRYKLIIFFWLTLVLLILFEPSMSSVFSIYENKLVDYKGDYNDIFILRLIMNFLGGFNSFYQNNNTAEFLMFLGGYVWRIVALFYIIKKDYVLFLKYCLFTGIILTIVYPFPHPRYLEPAIYLTLGILSVRSVSHKTRGDHDNS